MAKKMQKIAGDDVEVETDEPIIEDKLARFKVDPASGHYIAFSSTDITACVGAHTLTWYANKRMLLERHVLLILLDQDVQLTS